MDLAHKRIGEIKFSVLSPEKIKKMSVVKIVTPELYDKEGYPVDGGLMDTRLGVIDPSLRCRTCGGTIKECNGHYGYIQLARPVVHPEFVSLIHNLLKSTCKFCGRALISEKEILKYKKVLDQIEENEGFHARMNKIKEIIANVKSIDVCPHCNSKQPKITLEKPTTFVENEKRITPVDVRARLEMLSDDDLALFGLNPKAARPEWFVITLFPVPPVTMRPSITLESGERSEDDLTHKLGDIVRINQRLFENINAGAPEIIVEDLWDLLQYHITTYINNKLPQIPPARHRGGQILKTLIQRISSKHGRIRYNLVGKRVNFSSRTVISPDPFIEVDEVGVPEIIAKKLTVPEKVTPWNIEYLKKFIQSGPKKYPGANYVIRPDGRRKRITEETTEQLLEEIEPGYVVERHLIDGDIALFNRQPSLHRMSMMAHKVRVLPYRTFRLNPSVCNPYNADFDGDEMNLHIPQTEEAITEAKYLMSVGANMISPRHGLSIIGAIQDGISGNYLLTKKMTELTKEEAVDLLTAINVTDYKEILSKKKITGKDIVSVLLPNDFDFEGRCKDPDEPEVIIKKGKLISGVLDSSILGKGSGLLLRQLHLKYGVDFSLSFLAKILRLGITVNTKYGFSVYLSDGDLPEEANNKIRAELDKAYDDVNSIIDAYKNKTLDAIPGTNLEDTLEIKISGRLDKARNKIGNHVNKYAIKETPSLIMARSGARGNMLNLTQIAGCIGQQSIRGKRINQGYHGRTLSLFRKHDLGPQEGGFIDRGFKKGMTPSQFFFAAMTGRDALMDSALRTPKSGYLYRRLSNALQDLFVDYDGTVRDSGGLIIQYKYGEDAIDVSKSEGGRINVRRIVQEVLNDEKKQ